MLRDEVIQFQLHGLVCIDFIILLLKWRLVHFRFTKVCHICHSLICIFIYLFVYFLVSLFLFVCLFVYIFIYACLII